MGRSKTRKVMVENSQNLWGEKIKLWLQRAICTKQAKSKTNEKKKSTLDFQPDSPNSVKQVTNQTQYMQMVFNMLDIKK